MICCCTLELRSGRKKKQRKQEVWATLDRELVRGGMSKSASGEDERRKNKLERERGRKNKTSQQTWLDDGEVQDVSFLL